MALDVGFDVGFGVLLDLQFLGVDAFGNIPGGTWSSSVLTTGLVWSGWWWLECFARSRRPPTASMRPRSRKAKR